MELEQVYTETTIYRRTVEIDTEYQTEGSYALDTEQATRDAERHEREMIEAGIWTPYIVRLEQWSNFSGSWDLVDVVGGIVVENPEEALKYLP